MESSSLGELARNIYVPLKMGIQTLITNIWWYYISVPYTSVFWKHGCHRPWVWGDMVFDSVLYFTAVWKVLRLTPGGNCERNDRWWFIIWKQAFLPRQLCRAASLLKITDARFSDAQNNEHNSVCVFQLTPTNSFFFIFFALLLTKGIEFMRMIDMAMN